MTLGPSLDPSGVLAAHHRRAALGVARAQRNATRHEVQLTKAVPERKERRRRSAPVSSLRPTPAALCCCPS